MNKIYSLTPTNFLDHHGGINLRVAIVKTGSAVRREGAESCGWAVEVGTKECSTLCRCRRAECSGGGGGYQCCGQERGICIRSEDQRRLPRGSGMFKALINEQKAARYRGRLF